MITAAEARAKTILAWSEENLQTHVVGLGAGFGWMSYHTYNSRRSNPGYPDLHMLHPARGLSLFRELKSQKGRVSKDQKTWGDGLLAAGHDFAIWRPEDVVSGEVLHTLQYAGTPHCCQACRERTRL